MKKLFISGFVAVSALMSVNAQNQDFTVQDLDGNMYVDGQILMYNVHGTFGDPIAEAKAFFVYHNTGSETIRLYGQVVEMTNTDGEMAQFCNIDNCYFPLVEGGLYPGTGGFIPAGEFNGADGFNYFINLDENSPVEYKIRFFQGDVDSGLELPNTTLNLTYRYDEDATMGVTDVQSLAIAEVYPTVAKGFTNVTLKENAKVQILNAEGRLVKTTSLSSGNSQLNLAGLSAGVYWISFKGESGKTTTTRIVVK